MDEKYGGIVEFVASNISQQVSLVASLHNAERVGLFVYANDGPHLVWLFYRLLDFGKFATIHIFKSKLNALYDL